MEIKEKIKIIHFNNGRGGGVLSVIKNLIECSDNSEIENHVIYSIEKRIDPTIIPFPKAKTVQVFYYDRDWNFYYTCKKLGELIPDEKSVIIAHDWLEIGLVHQLGLTNPVIQFLHGDYEYYYNLATAHKKVVKQFICVSPAIEKKLIDRLSDRISDIAFLRFPVPNVEIAVKKESKAIRLIFCVRDLHEKIKRFYILPQINNILRDRGVEVDWTIIGSGKTDQEIRELFGTNVNYFPSLSNTQVYMQMQKADVLLHPTTSEGFPVVVVEAMKCGLVPLVTDWDGATANLINDGETGFLFDKDEIMKYALIIEKLSNYPFLLNQISTNAVKIARKLFDPHDNTIAIEKVIQAVSYRHVNERVTARKIYGSRLDNKWIPNFIVNRIRKSRR